MSHVSVCVVKVQLKNTQRLSGLSGARVFSSRRVKSLGQDVFWVSRGIYCTDVDLFAQLMCSEAEKEDERISRMTS